MFFGDLQIPNAGVVGSPTQVQPKADTEIASLLLVFSISAWRKYISTG
jgi:hypothetical protein